MSSEIADGVATLALCGVTVLGGVVV